MGGDCYAGVPEVVALFGGEMLVGVICLVGGGEGRCCESCGVMSESMGFPFSFCFLEQVE